MTVLVAGGGITAEIYRGSPLFVALRDPARPYQPAVTETPHPFTAVRGQA